MTEPPDGDGAAWVDWVWGSAVGEATVTAPAGLGSAIDSATPAPKPSAAPQRTTARDGPATRARLSSPPAGESSTEECLPRRAKI